MYGTAFEVGPNYEIVSPIGQGAYGVVVAAKVRNLNEAEGTEDGPNTSEEGKATNDGDEE